MACATRVECAAGNASKVKTFLTEVELERVHRRAQKPKVMWALEALAPQ
jgi:hypothetical protein